MIYHFPSLEVLNLVLRSQTLPGAVQVTPCKAHCSSTNEIWVDTAQKMTAATVKVLNQFGVTRVKKIEAPHGEQLSTIQATCWQQLIPLHRSSSDQSLDARTVLFRVASVEKFTALASEMLRLGNDRIGYRAIQTESSEEVMLLRVIEPPYYTLVDLLDSGSDKQATLYCEQAPRVWVRLRYQHPLATSIDPPAGHFLLIDPPNSFTFVAEAPFQDIYQALEVRLPAPPQAWQPADLRPTLPISLKLTSSGTSQAAELWVIRKSAMQQLQELIERSDDQLIQRLAFAVIPSDSEREEPVVVLRVRPSRLPPPILICEATSYSTYLRLPNLFLPVDKRLQPPLRRDAVANLLADDNRKITWLEVVEPDELGTEEHVNAARVFGKLNYRSFQTHSVADSAFRPLSDWVEYIIDHHAAALDAWTASHRFEFSDFICKDDVQERPPASDNSLDTRAASGTVSDIKPLPPTNSQTKKTKTAAVPPTNSLAALPEATPVSTNELAERLKQVEAEFLQSPEPFDAPARATGWHQLGQLNAELKHSLDATLSWTHLLWYAGNVNTDLTDQWWQAELNCSERKQVNLKNIGDIVRHRSQKAADVTLVAAYVVRAVTHQQETDELRTMAAELTNYFERHESSMPIRLVWLTALAMQRLIGGDALGLARVRDRILDRLYNHGLMGEFDIISFLRGSGQSQHNQHRVVQSRWPELFALIDRWQASRFAEHNKTKVYVKLQFAYCLVRIGEVIRGRQFMHEALERVKGRDPIHNWLVKAFEFRIEQAAKGGNNREPMPLKLMKKLDSMDRLDRYKIDRLRQHSRVLEPHVRIDPYRRWHGRYRDELVQQLAELNDVLDLKTVEEQLHKLRAEFPSGPRSARILASALEFAPRLGDAFATNVLTGIDQALAECEEVIERALLIHRAMYVAAHFGHTARVNALVIRLRNELPAIVECYLKLDSQYSPVDKERIETVESLLQYSLRGLRKLGMREELSALYRRVAELVETHHARAQETMKSGSGDAGLARRLSLLLCVASGYYFFGNTTEASSTVEKVRRVLLEGQLTSVEQRRLACSYLACISLGQPEEAMQRILELFGRQPNGERLLSKIEDTMTTTSHFTVSELELIETALLSLLSDESSWDSQSQLWLDQDEFAIRQRIHHDMKLACN